MAKVRLKRPAGGGHYHVYVDGRLRACIDDDWKKRGGQSPDRWGLYLVGPDGVEEEAIARGPSLRAMRIAASGHWRRGVVSVGGGHG